MSRQIFFLAALLSTSTVPAFAQTAEPSVPAPAAYKWQMSTGYEHSNFARRPQESWNEQFLQIDRMFGNLTAHGRFEKYDEFNRTDEVYEAGIAYRFSSRLNVYLTGAMSPGSYFRPRWDIAGGGEVRIDPEEMEIFPSWLTLDLRHDDYGSVSVRTFNLGTRVEPAEDWGISPKLIGVKQLGANTVYGLSLRFDGRFTSGWRFNIGYADAPETEAAVSVYTETMFGGLAIDITDATTLWLAYAHDDRQNSYIRHVVDASLSTRF